MAGERVAGQLQRAVDVEGGLIVARRMKIVGEQRGELADGQPKLEPVIVDEQRVQLISLFRAGEMGGEVVEQVAVAGRLAQRVGFGPPGELTSEREKHRALVLGGIPMGGQPLTVAVEQLRVPSGQPAGALPQVVGGHVGLQVVQADVPGVVEAQERTATSRRSSSPLAVLEQPAGAHSASTALRGTGPVPENTASSW